MNIILSLNVIFLWRIQKKSGDIIWMIRWQEMRMDMIVWIICIILCVCSYVYIREHWYFHYRQNHHYHTQNIYFYNNLSQDPAAKHLSNCDVHLKSKSMEIKKTISRYYRRNVTYPTTKIYDLTFHILYIVLFVASNNYISYYLLCMESIYQFSRNV